ncbi:nucleosome assembly protein [Cyclospora cayetanensis]|nr:nucleosome assembly protein [Cyclospora cayetanensis]
MEALTGALQRVTVDGGEVELAGIEESLSASERAVVVKLKELQEEHAALSAVFEAAVLRLKLEYEAKYQPLYQKRLEALSPQGAEGQSAETEATGTPGLPSFWLRALKANRLLADIIEEHDEGPLAYLRNIQCEWLSPTEGAAGASQQQSAKPEAGAPHPESFRLVFTFVENPYFKPLTLVKDYRLSVAPGGRGAELTSTHSTPIEWLEGKDVTKKTVIRKQRNRKTKQTRTVAETVDANSFFNLFVDHEIPSDEKLEQMEEKEVEELQMVVEADYDIGITIRDKIIPRAVDWFLGQVDDDSDFEDYDLNDEEFDSDESEEDEESSDEEPPRSLKGAAKGITGADGKGPDQKPDCKQQ